MDSHLIAQIVRQGGARVLELALGQALAQKQQDAKASRSIVGAVAGFALTRIATRSVPGAIVVGGGMLAKALYDRRRQKAQAMAQAGNAEAGNAETGITGQPGIAPAPDQTP